MAEDNPGRGMRSVAGRTAPGPWTGPVALGLVALFLLLRLPLILVAHIERMGLGHLLFATMTALGLWAGWSGLHSSGRANRIQSAAALLFFLAVLVLTVIWSRA